MRALSLAAGQPPRGFADFIASEIATWATVVKDAGINVAPQGSP